jgi:hypothetical protein
MMTVISETRRIGFTSAESIKKSSESKILQNPVYHNNMGRHRYYSLTAWLNISRLQIASENWYAQCLYKFNAVEPLLWIQI